MSPDEENTLVRDMRALAEDEDLCDVKLQGTDGKLVSASRTILGARSKVLKKMLFGEFSEARSPIVSLPFHSVDLRTIVKFFFTDEIECSEELSLEEQARSLVRIVAAGHYFDCPKLERKAYGLVNRVVLDHPPLACAIFEEATSDTALSVDLRSVALRIIETKPVDTLLPTASDHHGGIISIRDESVLRQIILNENMATDELTMLQCLKKWATADESKPSPDRLSIAKAIASKLNLSRIRPSDLSGVVTESGLVTFYQLMEAYKAQALVAERNGLASNNRRAVSWINPEFVLVDGAGMSIVNGTYLRNGIFDGIPSFSKTDEWEHRKVSVFFSVHRSVISCDTGLFLSFLKENGQGPARRLTSIVHAV